MEKEVQVLRRGGKVHPNLFPLTARVYLTDLTKLIPNKTLLLIAHPTALLLHLTIYESVPYPIMIKTFSIPKPLI